MASTLEVYVEHGDGSTERAMCVEALGEMHARYETPEGQRLRVKVTIDWEIVAHRYESVLQQQRQRIHDLEEALRTAHVPQDPTR